MILVATLARLGLVVAAALSVNGHDYGWAAFFGLTALTLWVDE